MNVRLNPRNLCKGQAAAERHLRNGYEGTSRRVASHRFVGGRNGKGCGLREMSSNLIAKKRTTWLGMCQQLVLNKKYIHIPTYPFLFVCWCGRVAVPFVCNFIFYTVIVFNWNKIRTKWWSPHFNKSPIRSIPRLGHIVHVLPVQPVGNKAGPGFNLRVSAWIHVLITFRQLRESNKCYILLPPHKKRKKNWIGIKFCDGDTWKLEYWATEKRRIKIKIGYAKNLRDR